jgi:hypothetical protein
LGIDASFKKDLSKRKTRGQPSWSRVIRLDLDEVQRLGDEFVAAVDLNIK